MATLVAENPRIYKLDGPAMETVKKYILNGQSWKAGQFLYTDTSDYLKTCATVADAGTGGIKYLALTDQDDPAVNTTLAEVGVITADMIFIGNELDGTVVATQVGDECAIDVTSNVVTINSADTGNDAVEIVDLMCNLSPAEYDIADTLAKITFKIIPTALEAAQA